MKDVRHIDLSVFGREPRGALDVDLLVKGETIRVIVAHLGLGLRERRKQIRRLLDIFCSERDRMEIMLGDFNEWVPLEKSAGPGPQFFWKIADPEDFSFLHAGPAARQNLDAAHGRPGEYVYAQYTA